MAMDAKAKQDACQELGIPIELYEELLNDYFRDGSERMAQIKQALDSSMPAEMGRVAHALKGSSLNLRIPSIAESAKKLELAAKSGADSTALRALYGELESGWKALPG